MLFCLGNVTNLLDFTQCHTHYHIHPFYFMLFKVKDLVAKQHPTTAYSKLCASIIGYLGNITVHVQ